MEQLVNTWLADQKPASDDLRAVCGEAMRQFSRWVEDIATGAATPWSAQPFRKSADALRVDNQRVDLLPPGASPAVEASAAAPTVEPTQPPVQEPVPTGQDMPAFAVAEDASDAVEAADADADMVSQTASAPMETRLETSPAPMEDASADEAPADAVLTEDDAFLFDAADSAFGTLAPQPDAPASPDAPDFVATQMFQDSVSAAGPASVPPDFHTTELASGHGDGPDTQQPDFQPTQTFEKAPSGTPQESDAAPVSGLGDIDFDFGSPPAPEVEADAPTPTSRPSPNVARCSTNRTRGSSRRKPRSRRSRSRSLAICASASRCTTSI